MPPAPMFLSLREAAAALGFPVTVTEELFHAHGLIPIDLGRGRGRGRRWASQDVKALADTLQAEAHAKTPAARQRDDPHPISGKTIGELMRSLKE